MAILFIKRIGRVLLIRDDFLFFFVEKLVGTENIFIKGSKRILVLIVQRHSKAEINAYLSLTFFLIFLLFFFKCSD